MLEDPAGSQESEAQPNQKETIPPIQPVSLSFSSTPQIYIQLPKD